MLANIKGGKSFIFKQSFGARRNFFLSSALGVGAFFNKKIYVFINSE